MHHHLSKEDSPFFRFFLTNIGEETGASHSFPIRNGLDGQEVSIE